MNPDSKIASRVKRDGFDFELPEELFAADTRVLGKVVASHETLELIFEGLPDEQKAEVLARLPGRYSWVTRRNDREKFETFARLARNEKMGFGAPLEQFNHLLQKGHFSELYHREREVERLTNSFHYKQVALQNHRHYVARCAAKTFENRLNKAEQSLFASVGRLRPTRQPRHGQARRGLLLGQDARVPG